MLEEQGVVVAVEPGAIWVETVRASTCGACKAKAGCGHHLINEQQSGQRARLRVPSQDSHQVGDTVNVALPEGALMRGALWVYGLPLALLFAGALLGEAVPIEIVDASALLGMAGLFLGFAINRVMSRQTGHTQAYQPRVVPSADSCQAVVIQPASQ
ncbi:SoxR reducing system RseC family protein [Alcanivorax sp.]|jgi:sigma-E factor negative regulatory protein RseC|uniref:SoxR reducing system RseC family protein n=1 Tax=Alcanivorax sp. TaxID=1872427 RepID=UPI0032D91ED2